MPCAFNASMIAGNAQLLVRRHLVVRLGDLQRHPLRAVERLGVLLLVDVAAAGVRARLEDRPRAGGPGSGARIAAIVSRTAVG